ncbi:uncharacterized protein LOC100827575 [Brachypodium distachyon]|uniref:Uncharacterized protein n=1 Tax=Brachypodium distachyon TaxID=15368 RepID=A0A0Q3G6X5_BRADI|nr:uncharacterized protein LOC100827575 [Brachypodium distachyon]KQK06197.1 hypothetical protein BRADI_2g25060v3 [Brachypodium distachyon]|eukprot:XP_003568428.1 uncharacterized protein LOC100827575 [Brachypodium distachyon]
MWALNMKAGGPCLTPIRPAPTARAGAPLAAGGKTGAWSARRRHGPVLRHLVAMRASGKRAKNGPGDDEEAKNKASSSGSDDASVPTGDSSDGSNGPHDESKPSEPIDISNSNYWRDVRANLVRREQELLVDSSAPAESKASSGESVPQLPQRWAHPITMPEAGCVLVATEVLDDDSIFERTVILLLRLGSRGTFDGPFGVILNRPLYTKIKNVNPSSFQDQTTPFGDCSLFFGGPVDMSMFLVRTSDSSRLKGFEEVIPGICFGFRTELEKAGVLMKSGAIRTQDLRFFVGHAAWDYEQLLSEIRAGYWAVASCSTELIGDAVSTDPSCLWTDILQLMGGHYSELSQKPKQDSS